MLGLKSKSEYVCRNICLKVSLCSDTFSMSAEEQPVGSVSNLRVVESLGSTVRLGWTGVAGATQYRIIILNTEGTLMHFICYYSGVFHAQLCIKTYENCVSACLMSCQREQRKSGVSLATRRPLTSETWQWECLMLSLSQHWWGQMKETRLLSPSNQVGGALTMCCCHHVFSW